MYAQRYIGTYPIKCQALLIVGNMYLRLPRLHLLVLSPSANVTTVQQSGLRALARASHLDEVAKPRRGSARRFL
jgi:hypothetical protein